MFGKKTFLIISTFPILSLIFLNVFSNQIFTIFEYFTKDLNFANHPYIGLNITEIIEKDGFHFEIHEIPTEDGYILTYFRIPYKRDSKNKNLKRRPVLIHHGLGSSAADFVILGSEKSLPYKLVEEGIYDVWLANFRGSSYSRKHQNLSVDAKEFWDFTFDEIGRYDIPAAIKYILKVTQEEKLFYIGHSMGGNSFFAGMSENPELNDKIILMVDLAAAVYTEGVKDNLIKTIASHSDFDKKLWAFFGCYELLPRSFLHLFKLFGRTICTEKSPIFRGFCAGFLNTFGTNAEERVDSSVLSLIFQFFPSSVGMNVYHHAAQTHLSGEFKQYDLGLEGNLKKYGHDRPPFYNLGKVKCPVVIFNGEAEVFFSKEDNDKLVSELPNVVGDFRILEREDFGHMDFIFANDADIVLYDKIIKFMKKY